MDVKIEPSWKEALADEWDKDYFEALTRFVRGRYAERIVSPSDFIPEILSMSCLSLLLLKNPFFAAIPAPLSHISNSLLTMQTTESKSCPF